MMEDDELYRDSQINYLMKGLKEGISEQYIPHMLLAYDINYTCIKACACKLVSFLQEKAYEYNTFGIKRKIPTYSLFIERCMTLCELKTQLQKLQDYANSVGENEYKGYILLYLSDIFAPADVCIENELLNYIIFNVLNKPNIRALIVVHDSIYKCMDRLLSCTLSLIVINLPDVLRDCFNDNKRERELRDVFKEALNNMGVIMPESSEEFVNELIEIIPKDIRRPEYIMRIVCQITFDGNVITREMVKKYSYELYEKLDRLNKTEIGFRI